MIKYLFLDVDGTLTDGKIYIGNDGEILKAFSIKDGYAFNYILKPLDIIPVIITGRKSRIVQNRCNELGITDIYQDVLNKYEKVIEIVGQDNLSECAYFGDDLIDYEAMKAIKDNGGYTGCPGDASEMIKEIADYVCKEKAGEGAFREFAEVLAYIAKKNIVECRVDEALDYIKYMDKSNLIQGQYKVNEWFNYSVKEYDTVDRKECLLESHKKYIDIQWIVYGEEIIEIINSDTLKETKAYSPVNDICLYETVVGMNRIMMIPNSYAIIYPNSAHMGCIKTTKKSHVLKIVGKVDCVNF